MYHLSGEAARSMLGRMPARLEEELDPVTLHNQALFHLDQQPAAAVAKLQFLLRQETFPSETFENLLLLYTKYEVRDVMCSVTVTSGAGSKLGLVKRVSPSRSLSSPPLFSLFPSFPSLPASFSLPFPFTHRRPSTSLHPFFSFRCGTH